MSHLRPVDIVFGCAEGIPDFMVTSVLCGLASVDGLDQTSFHVGVGEYQDAREVNVGQPSPFRFPLPDRNVKRKTMSLAWS